MFSKRQYSAKQTKENTPTLTRHEHASPLFCPFPEQFRIRKRRPAFRAVLVGVPLGRRPCDPSVKDKPCSPRPSLLRVKRELSRTLVLSKTTYAGTRELSFQDQATVDRKYCRKVQPPGKSSPAKGSWNNDGLNEVADVLTSNRAYQTVQKDIPLDNVQPETGRIKGADVVRACERLYTNDVVRRQLQIRSSLADHYLGPLPTEWLSPTGSLRTSQKSRTWIDNLGCRREGRKLFSSAYELLIPFRQSNSGGVSARLEVKGTKVDQQINETSPFNLPFHWYSNIPSVCGAAGPQCSQVNLSEFNNSGNFDQRGMLPSVIMKGKGIPTLKCGVSENYLSRGLKEDDSRHAAIPVRHVADKKKDPFYGYQFWNTGSCAQSPGGLRSQLMEVCVSQYA